MKVKPIRSKLIKYLEKRVLIGKFKKQINVLESNIQHPSLNTERLEPKELKLYSFRIDRKYRAIFAFTKYGEIEIIDINDHYK